MYGSTPPSPGGLYKEMTRSPLLKIVNQCLSYSPESRAHLFLANRKLPTHLIKTLSLYYHVIFWFCWSCFSFCLFVFCLSDLCLHLFGWARWDDQLWSDEGATWCAFTLLTSDLNFLVLPQLSHATGCKRGKLTCTITFRVLYLYSSRQQRRFHWSHRKSESWN